MSKLGFPPGLWVQDGDGLFTRFDSLDRLTDMYWAEAHEPAGHRLRLDHNRQRGELEWPQGSGGTADFESYRDGEWELFNAWSDGSLPKSMPWSDWVIKVVTSFAANCQCVLCGFGLNHSPPSAYSPCETQFLCAPCFQWTREGTPSARRWPLGERHCAQCEKACDDQENMYEGRSAKLCTSCAPSFQPVQR